ncbi:hypothetical protein NRB20_73270 [Nocardia sp. RB20]|uniref:Uncharacterized protein n=1 Tax=Nocardia macrotermitis TaxID=2585198 RepID=A0A7K0DEG3_9NOCA|nr:hypothetical protein [Nocardia macrotermitis]
MTTYPTITRIVNHCMGRGGFLGKRIRQPSFDSEAAVTESRHGRFAANYGTTTSIDAGTFG